MEPSTTLRRGTSSRKNSLIDRLKQAVWRLIEGYGRETVRTAMGTSWRAYTHPDSTPEYLLEKAMEKAVELWGTRQLGKPSKGRTL